MPNLPHSHQGCGSRPLLRGLCEDADKGRKQPGLVPGQHVRRHVQQCPNPHVHWGPRSRRRGRLLLFDTASLRIWRRHRLRCWRLPLRLRSLVLDHCPGLREGGQSSEGSHPHDIVLAGGSVASIDADDEGCSCGNWLSRGSRRLLRTLCSISLLDQTSLRGHDDRRGSILLLADSLLHPPSRTTDRKSRKAHSWRPVLDWRALLVGALRFWQKLLLGGRALLVGALRCRPYHAEGRICSVGNADPSSQLCLRVCFDPDRTWHEPSGELRVQLRCLGRQLHLRLDPDSDWARHILDRKGDFRLYSQTNWTGHLLGLFEVVARH
mmetsp:Transcript_16821/g.36183  ORF Transcript_16821/g.36183 Transcript_16821/m.36183 type:complete len:323 (+) Transcript_16821:461-1429(+)